MSHYDLAFQLKELMISTICVILTSQGDYTSVS